MLVFTTMSGPLYVPNIPLHYVCLIKPSSRTHTSYEINSTRRGMNSYPKLVNQSMNVRLANIQSEISSKYSVRKHKRFFLRFKPLFNVIFFKEFNC